MILRTKNGMTVKDLTKGSNQLVLRICDDCGCSHWIKYYKIYRSRQLNGYDRDYCKPCSYKHRTNKGGPQRDPNGKIDDKGYRCHYIGGKKYLAHRMTAELILRRKLQNDEVVHHVDGDKTNNDWSNLIVCSSSQHSQLHANLEAIAMKAVQIGLIRFNGTEYELHPEHHDLV